MHHKMGVILDGMFFFQKSCWNFWKVGVGGWLELGWWMVVHSSLMQGWLKLATISGSWKKYMWRKNRKVCGNGIFIDIHTFIYTWIWFIFMIHLGKTKPCMNDM